MATKNTTPTVVQAEAAASTPAADSQQPLVLVRFLKKTKVSACGGVFAAGAHTKLRLSTAQDLEQLGFVTIEGK